MAYGRFEMRGVGGVWDSSLGSKADETEEAEEAEEPRRTAYEYLLHASPLESYAAAGEYEPPEDARRDPVPGLSPSRLTDVKRSIADFLWHYEHPKQTPDTVLGTATHIATLEPHRFESRYYQFEDGRIDGEKIDRRYNEGKRRWQEYVEQLGDREGMCPLTPEQWDLAHCMADAVRQHPEAAEILAAGRTEVSISWIDTHFVPNGHGRGFLCKGRLDWIAPELPKWWQTGVMGSRDCGVIIDLKTGKDASADYFSRWCADNGYHIQCAMYADGWALTTGDFPPVGFIVVEKKPPHNVSVLPIDTETQRAGVIDYTRQLEKIWRFLTDKKPWHGLPLRNKPIQLPPWKRKEIMTW